MELDGFKWDVQVGDRVTLAPFAIVLPAIVWRGLANLAESLAAELVAAETELAQRPELWPELGLPRRVRRALEISEPWTPCAARVIRFDFHPTLEGWRISEANGDVPGGYTEATRFTQLMAAHTPGARPAGDPTAALCDALARPAHNFRRIALLASPGLTSDQQVTAHLAAALRERGLATCCASPEQLSWHHGIAHVGHGTRAHPVDVVFRFYQGEWMPRLRSNEWRFLFRGGRTPVCNPAAAVLSESKRLPLLWPQLAVAMPTWDRLLAATHHASATWLQPKREWVLKGAYGNTGENVHARAWSRHRDFFFAQLNASFASRRWVAQTCFDTTSLSTPHGPLYPCVGVYTVDGRAAGLYGRLSPTRLIDFAALDTAVLIGD